MKKLHEKIKNHESTIGIIGLGYVGLPLALRLSEESFKIIGFDSDEKKIVTLKKNETYIKNIHHQIQKKLFLMQDIVLMMRYLN